MPSSTDLLISMVEQYSKQGEKYLKRIQEANEALQNDKYSFSHLMKDAIGTWADAVTSLWLPMQSNSAGAPTLLFVLGPVDQLPGEQEISTELEGDPEGTDLIQMGAGGATIAKDKLDLSRDKDVIRVRFQNLAAARPAAGLYVGAIHIKARPAALLHFLVLPPVPAGG